MSYIIEVVGISMHAAPDEDTNLNFSCHLLVYSDADSQLFPRRRRRHPLFLSPPRLIYRGIACQVAIRTRPNPHRIPTPAFLPPGQVKKSEEE